MEECAMKGFVWLGMLIASSLLGNAQGTLRTITFEGPPAVPPDSDIGVSFYEEGGMYFTPIPPDRVFGRAGGGRDGFPQNGSAYLIFALGDSLRGAMDTGESF